MSGPRSAADGCGETGTATNLVSQLGIDHDLVKEMISDGWVLVFRFIYSQLELNQFVQVRSYGDQGVGEVQTPDYGGQCHAHCQGQDRRVEEQRGQLRPEIRELK